MANIQPELKRGAGILLPVSSLPSPYGIGTLGRAAYDFVDELVRAGQSYWQVLPVGPTSFGDSPYQSFSAFAGNPYFIDLDTLADDGLLDRSELQSIDWGTDADDVDYAKIYNNRYRILKKAYLAFLSSDNRKVADRRGDFRQFREINSEWLNDYALFMALKDRNDGRSWQEWDDDIKRRKPEIVTYYKDLLKEQIDFYCFLQFEFYRQWTLLKRYANNHDIQIIGDIPIYVALDSSDVWCNPESFQLGDNLAPIDVAGCPPDAFSDYGQKWGNPLYDWKKMKQDGFTWWKKRMAAAANLYDIVRIDHFLGVVRYYSIPADKDPVDGHYEEGPGQDLTDAISEVMGDSKIIAEDLGVVVPGVKDLLKKTGYPGMKILEFAFDGNRENEYLPHMYERNCVVYSGTHDNETLKGYFKSLSPMGYQYLLDYTGAEDDKGLIQKIFRMAYMSIADTVILQMQDILEKDNSARMNLPSTIGTNWRWRMTKGEFDDEKQQELRKLADTYARNENRKVNKGQMVAETVKKLYNKDIRNCSDEEIYVALLHLVRDMAEERRSDAGKKKVYYISAEFLIGKLLSNNMLNLGIFEDVKKELEENGKDIYRIEEIENEPSLGNGGLGRLAACFLDSMASLGIHGDGIGINYHLGLFKQVFENNLQKETPNPWITKDSWLIDRQKEYTVEFRYHTVHAHLYDIPVTGYENRTNELHLFDIDSVDEHITQGDGIDFNKEDIEKNLTLFLYPDDSDDKGRMLRIYQEYFMVSAGAQLIIDECIARGSNLHDLADYAAIQINDTHPSMVIPELIRLLTQRGIDVDEACDIVTKTCAYTNHTILAEALETWNFDFMNQVVPQLMPIITILDAKVKNKYKDASTYIIDDNRNVHMAFMDIHFSHSVNGVAYLHTEILKNTELHNFYELYPDKFNNKTNGITFRRWLLDCNPELTELIESKIGDGFKKDSNELKKLMDYVDDKETLEALRSIKVHNKKRFADYMKTTQGIELDGHSIFDVQVKRLHEYKRQQLNLLFLIHMYLEIKRGKKPVRPVTAIFGAKAAPAYTIAKDIIHLILCMQQITANDPDVAPYLKVVMIENYNVTAASIVIPAADVSEQISLASKEASGTSNMKFMLNGAVTLGTMDGANVEIADLVGKDNIYTFGEDSQTVIDRYARGDYNSRSYYEKDPVLKEAVDFIVSDTVRNVGNSENLERLYNELLNKDWFMTFPDFEDYLKTREQVFNDFEDRDAWAKKCLVNIANAGFFSSDRTIDQYDKEIWHTR